MTPDTDDRFGIFLPENASDLQAAFHGPTMQSLRQAMLSGELPNGCLSCHRIEAAGDSSLRTASNARFGTPTTPSLSSLEIGFSNICNLKCRSCNPTNAAKLHKEAVALGEIPEHPVILSSGITFDGVDLSALRRLKFYGGEPMFHQEKITDLLARIKQIRGSLDHLAVDLATNGTRLPDRELMSLLDTCERVEWQFSIDATGRLNDYIRDGSRFDALTENLSVLCKSGHRVMPYTTVSVLNVNVLPVLREWIIERHPTLYHHHFAAVAPTQIAVRNLPDSIKAKIIPRLAENAFVRVRTELALPARIAPDAITSRLNAMDRYRGQCFSDVNPEMAGWLEMPSRPSSSPA